MHTICRFLCVPAGRVLVVASGGVISCAAEIIVGAATQQMSAVLLRRDEESMILWVFVQRRNKYDVFCCVAKEKCWFCLFFVQRRNKMPPKCCVAAQYSKPVQQTTAQYGKLLPGLQSTAKSGNSHSQQPQSTATDKDNNQRGATEQQPRSTRRQQDVNSTTATVMTGDFSV